MLFHVTWEFTDRSEEGSGASLATFGAWQPPAGVTFHGFYGNADGSGGVAIVETDDAADVARTVAPFAPWLSFTVRPIIPIEQSAQIAGEARAWRASLG